jgi:hypothetical protein
MALEDISQPSNHWEFTEALDLLAAWRILTPSPPRTNQHPNTPPSPSPLYKAHLYDPKSSKPSGLGDLGRLFDFLGISHESSSSITHERTDSASSSASDKSTPPSSLPDDPIIEDLISKGKEVRWTDEVDGNHVAESGRRNTSSSSFILDTAPKSILNESDFENSTPSRNTRSRRKSRARSIALVNTSEFESEPEYHGPNQQHSKRRSHARERSNQEDTPLQTTNTTLIPSSVILSSRPKPIHTIWKPPPILKIPFNPHEIRPIDTPTQEEKYAKLVKKLRSRFTTDSTTLIQMKLCHLEGEYGRTFNPDGIHVFVDCSNIVIGFLDELKRKGGMNVRSPARGSKISWQALALILERGRPVARRIVVGSHGSPLHSKQLRRPDYMLEAENCGYELNILERVIKTKDATPHKRRRGNGNGYATASGYSSGSDGTYMTRKAVTEQGVDEILHMKLLESLVDTTVPSTIVLASGDAAEAEYSGGFLKNVERALKNGWKVELVSWSAGLSKDYQSDTFLRQWKGRFSTVLLDDFSEEMLAIYTGK